jgi:hypothetical protein
MGVLLLLGTMLLFAASVPWLLPPSNAICAVRSVVCFFHEKVVFFWQHCCLHRPEPLKILVFGSGPGSDQIFVVAG